ncbi:hypothetical protein Nepgr_017987 [Nepenthes gracilis]|uniref:Uncharacterized protein n=1 Tax=Nepenthes gracilis TaxID=150966 RepID=A0AAD3STT9_NEPGR|nr:hypothetical protein Nepgr_017987 [Nepenthes gracilis]
MQDHIHHVTAPPHPADEPGTNQHTPDYKSSSATSFRISSTPASAGHCSSQSASQPTNISKGRGYQTRGIIPFFTMQQNGSTPPTASNTPNSRTPELLVSGVFSLVPQLEAVLHLVAGCVAASAVLQCVVRLPVALCILFLLMSLLAPCAICVADAGEDALSIIPASFSGGCKKAGKWTSFTLLRSLLVSKFHLRACAVMKVKCRYCNGGGFGAAQLIRSCCLPGGWCPGNASSLIDILPNPGADIEIHDLSIPPSDGKTSEMEPTSAIDLDLTPNPISRISKKYSLVASNLGEPFSSSSTGSLELAKKKSRSRIKPYTSK